jgi:hypothetical protein
MIDPEQDRILHRARLRRERIAILRRRRAIDELHRQIDFGRMWADPRRRAAFDHQRRLFYQRRPQLYEPIPKMIGRRALLASLGALLATPGLAQAPHPIRPNGSHKGARMPRTSGTKPDDKIGARVDVRNFSTGARAKSTWLSIKSQLLY